MILIAGLGNPGTQYKDTRHNIGWMVLAELARRHAIDVTRKSFESRLGSGLVAQVRVVLAQPQTYMNLSGRAVAGLLRYYSLLSTQQLVV